MSATYQALQRAAATLRDIDLVAAKALAARYHVRSLKTVPREHWQDALERVNALLDRNCWPRAYMGLRGTR